MASAHPRDEDPIEIVARLRAMLEQEAADHYAVPDYLAPEWQRRLRDAAPADDDGPSSPRSAASDPSDDHRGASDASSAGSSSSPSKITEVWRENICEWCYQVVDHFDFDREAVSFALNYLDRYLAARPVDRRTFQLAAMAALYLSIKLFEPRKVRPSGLAGLSRGQFLAEHIVAMEESMLRTLGWRVHPPTAQAFARDFRGLLLVGPDLSVDARREVGELSRFLVELSVCDYWFATRRASSVALASVVLALELRGLDPRRGIEFLRRAADAGADVADDAAIAECYERLRAVYLAGGHRAAAGPEGGVEGRPQARFETESPVGVEDGPDAPGEEEARECA